MIKVTVECEDLFTEEQKKVDLYFHLTEAELVSLNLTSNKGFSNYKNLSKEDVGKTEIVLFEKLIEKAYGQKTEDGQFIKDETARKAFLCSPEYSALLTKLSNGELSLNDFIMGCFPKNISSRIKINDDGSVALKES